MNTTNATPAGQRTHWPLIIILALLAATGLYFVQQKLHYYSDFSLASYGEYFWGRRLALVPHLFGGILALGAGIVQLWLGLTHRIGQLHRNLGKVYVTGVVIGSLGGFYMSLNIPPGYFAYAMGLFFLSVAWVTNTGMAVWCIRQRQIEQHREWMIRSYVVTFAFVSFRLVNQWLHTYFNQPDNDVSDDLGTAMAWACWAVPLLLAEPLIQMRRVGRGRPA